MPRQGKKYLRLYTSDSETEKDAQILYEKYGLNVVDGRKFEEIYKAFEEIGENEGETRIFRELKL